MEFDWEAGNIRHLANHDVTPVEFEQLMGNDPLDLDYKITGGEEPYRSVGLTNGGRFLTVIWTVRRGKGPGCYHFSRRFAREEDFSGEIPMKKQSKREVPAFGSEAEEAEWWFQNRKAHEKQLVAAAKTGEARILTKEKLMERIAASRKAPSPVVALRIPQSDLTLARKQAAEKGLPYQTYIKSVLHETLEERERRKAR